MGKLSKPARGAAAVAAVLILSIGQLVITGAVTAVGDTAALAVQRANSMRSFLAAESGVGIMLTELNAGRSLPTGAVALSGGATVELQVPAGSPPYDVTIIGRSAQAERRVVASIE